MNLDHYYLKTHGFKAAVAIVIQIIVFGSLIVAAGWSYL